MLLHRLSLADLVLVPLYPDEAQKKRVRLGPNQSLRNGTVLAERLDQPGVFVPYQFWASDGTQVAKLILETDCAIDENGVVHLGTLTVGQSPAQENYSDAYCFFQGTFRTEELTGLDSQAVAQTGRLIEGTTARGVFRMS